MPELTLSRIARFWLPLQATWFMMAVEGPFLAMVIARLENPELNLAAYGVAFAFAIISEAPVIMMMSASTALVDARPSYLALRRFVWLLNLALTGTMVLVLSTPTMGWILGELMGLDATICRLTTAAMWILLPFPAAIGYRRFYQGILIRAGFTRRVAWGTVVRLLAMASAATVAALSGLEGVLVGAAALTSGVCAEAVAARLMVVAVLRDLPATSTEEQDLSFRGLFAFYWPLALTSTISLGVHPLVTFFMGRAQAPLESLATLPVLNALIFVFRTPALAYQEVVIATLGKDRRHLPQVLRFATLLALGATALLGVIAWTPLWRVWFETISGLSPELAAYTMWPVRILTLMPALSLLMNLQRSLLVHGRHTRPVTTASLLEVGGIALTLALGVLWLDVVGVTVAAVAYMVGRGLANAHLVRPALAVVRRIRRAS